MPGENNRRNTSAAPGSRSGRKAGSKVRYSHGSRRYGKRRGKARRGRSRHLRWLVILLLIPLTIFVLCLSTVISINRSLRRHRNLRTDEICYLAAKYECNGHAESVGESVDYQAYGEYQFYYAYELVPFVDWCYEKNSRFYAAFEPYLEMSTESIPSADFRDVWMALAEKDYETFERDQQAFVMENTLEPVLETLTEAYGFDFTKADNALKACVLSFANRDGKSLKSMERFFGETTKDSTEEEIIKRAYAAMQQKRPTEKRWILEEEDCLALLDGSLNVYEKSENAAGGLDWSWKEKK